MDRAVVDHRRLERALLNKKPVPEIDFTLHTMEDGTQVSTMDRVCKGTVLFGIQILLDHKLTLSPENPTEVQAPALQTPPLMSYSGPARTRRNQICHF